MIVKKRKQYLASLILASMLAGGALTGCSQGNTETKNQSSVTDSTSNNNGSGNSANSNSNTNSNSGTKLEATIDTTNLFTERDLEQEADLANAKQIIVADDKDISITEEGVYVLSGTAKEVTVKVEAADDAKVQIVLDNVNITNTDAPAIYVKTGDKAFVTTTKNSKNTLAVTGSFVADGETNLDAVIFSKSDLILNGTGNLSINCTDGNGITSKDDLKATGGTYVINTSADGMEANDSVVISDGSFTIDSKKDAIHCENADDLTKGFIYISGGTFNLTATDDGIQGTSIVQIDGGTIKIPSAAEGIEGTYIRINEGTIDIYATDDGINATNKSDQYNVVVEFNGGSTKVSMGAGDTDAIDANGCIYVNGGTIDVTAGTSSFDYDDSAEFNGGTIIVNGEEVTEIPASMMHGGGHGGGGQRGDGSGGGRGFGNGVKQEKEGSEYM